jgi:putative membrane protein
MSFMTLFWFGLVALIVWAIVTSRPGRTLSTTEGPRSDHALTILRERYARGEINADEYEQRRKILDDLDP